MRNFPPITRIAQINADNHSDLRKSARSAGNNVILKELNVKSKINLDEKNYFLC
jgi:type II secretory pathway component PulL